MGVRKRSLNLLQQAAFVNKWRHPEPERSDFPHSKFEEPPRKLIALILVALTLILPVNGLGADQKNAIPAKYKRQLDQLIDNGAYGISRDGKLQTALDPDRPLIPASIIKILTSLAALEKLGPDYRFKTEFYLDDANNLFIKGYGDPYLTSEEVQQIASSLKKEGINTINNIHLDYSSYQLEKMADGVGTSLNPYDVASSPLAVNFNTINIVVDETGTVQSAEPQTPLLPIMVRLGKKLPPGEEHRINVSLEPADSLLLTGQLFRSFLEKAGIGGEGEIAEGRAEGKPIYTHYSGKTLREIVAGLMLYSNNYIANQIFLKIGGETFGYPATWEKGRKAVMAYIENDPVLKEANIKVYEGSGISRNNRITVRAMLRLLELFKPQADLLAKKNGVRVKSGTLTGVNSYAGYLEGKDGMDSFVIILNQDKNNRDAILRILQRIPQ